MRTRGEDTSAPPCDIPHTAYQHQYAVSVEPRIQAACTANSVQLRHVCALVAHSQKRRIHTVSEFVPTRSITAMSWAGRVVKLPAVQQPRYLYKNQHRSWMNTYIYKRDKGFFFDTVILSEKPHNISSIRKLNCFHLYVGVSSVCSIDLTALCSKNCTRVYIR